MSERTVTSADWHAPAGARPHRTTRRPPTSAESDQEQSQRITALGWRLVVGAIAATLLVVGVMLYVLLTAGRLGAEYGAWIAGTGRVKLEASQAYVSLQTFLSGESELPIASVWDHLDQADRYAESLLLGPKAELPGFVALEDPRSRRQVDIMRDRLIAFRQSVRERLDASVSGQVTPEVRKRNQDAFQQFLQQANELEARLHDAERIDRSHFRRNGVALIALLVVFAAMVTVVLNRFERRRTEEYRSVQRATEKFQQQNDALDYLAHFDTLTQLPNRTLFFDRTAQVLAHANRRNQWAVLMFLDLDGFKSVNDSLGHPLGDALLEVTAERLTRIMREEDTIARLGGDEFTILLPYQGSRVEAIRSASAVAEKIMAVFREPVTLGASETQVTASIGIALYPQDGDSVDELLRNADTAMYHAKTAGRNNYQFFSEEMNTVIRHRVVMEAGLKRALERGELLLFYQPIVELATGKVIGAEALLRWDHPEHGLLLPNRFLHVAEETGAMTPIGDWVLEEVCHQHFVWKATCPSWQRISVNLGAVQFRQPEMIDAILNRVSSCRLADGSLEVDISESALMADVDHSRRILETLRQIGVRIAIDDFGTGYSSIANLRRFDVDTLKIHQSFMADLDDQPASHPVVTAMIEFAHNLNFEIIAEGVETESQRDFLLEHGCEKAQGLLFGLPMPAEAFTTFVNELTHGATRATGNSES